MHFTVITFLLGSASASEADSFGGKDGAGVRVKVDTSVWQSSSIDFDYDKTDSLDVEYTTKGISLGTGGRVYGGYRLSNGLEFGSAVGIEDLLFTTDPSEGDDIELDTYLVTLVPAVTWNQPVSESVELFASAQYYWASYGEEPEDKKQFGYEEYVEVSGGFGLGAGSRFYLVPGASVDVGLEWFGVSSSTVDWEPDQEDVEYDASMFTIRTGLSIVF